MTPRERLLRVLDGRPTDQIPVWLLFPYHRTGYYVDVRTHDRYRRVFDYSRESGVIMLDRRHLEVRLHSNDVTYENADTNASDEPVRRHSIRHGSVRLYSELPGGKKLLATDEDLEAFCRLPIQKDILRNLPRRPG